MSRRHDTMPASRTARWAAGLDRLPHFVRVVLSLLITLELVALGWAAVSILFDINFLDPNPDLTLPLVLTIGLGLVVYGIGWWAMVGFDNVDWRPGMPAILYVLVGVIGLVVLVLLVILGLAGWTG